MKINIMDQTKLKGNHMLRADSAALSKWFGRPRIKALETEPVYYRSKEVCVTIDHSEELRLLVEESLGGRNPIDSNYKPSVE
jgi:hypothetical protein